MDMTPGEWLGIAIALLSFLGGGLAWFTRNQLAPLHENGRQTARTLEIVVTTLDKLEDAHHEHQQAGVTWARAVHRHLVNEGHRNPPDPDDYPGM